MATLPLPTPIQYPPLLHLRLLMSPIIQLLLPEMRRRTMSHRQPTIKHSENSRATMNLETRIMKTALWSRTGIGLIATGFVAHLSGHGRVGLSRRHRFRSRQLTDIRGREVISEFAWRVPEARWSSWQKCRNLQCSE